MNAKRLPLLMVILLAALLVSAGRPGPRTAWFAGNGYFQTIPTGQAYTALTPAFFDQQEPGLVTLTDKGFETTHSDLIKISGTCRMKYAPVMLRMRILMDGQYGVPIVETRNQVVSFNITVQPAAVMQIEAQHDSSAYWLPLACHILFETVD